MKITYMTAAQALLFLAVCLPEAAQTSVNPNHGSDRSPQISVSTQEDQVKARQQQLEGYEKQLRAKAEQVENARQQAISAGIQGDGAGPFIDAYRQEQKELEVLKATLAPQIEVVADSNSRERTQASDRMIASRGSSKLNLSAK
ncbi:MAG TPA: hypothetical protein VKE93_05355 [Candidatus Angelobacter sp.]|nr:hypothetical protein [Candidatus Angelobacter sp.]